MRVNMMEIVYCLSGRRKAAEIVISMNDFRRTARSEMNAISTTISDEHRSTSSSTV